MKRSTRPAAGARRQDPAHAVSTVNHALTDPDQGTQPHRRRPISIGDVMERLSTTAQGFNRAAQPDDAQAQTQISR